MRHTSIPKVCAVYKLTTDNDGDAFTWTSNVQVLGKVILKPHPTQRHVHILNASDKKMCMAGLKRLKTGGDPPCA